MARSTKQTSQGGPHLDRWHYFDYRDGKHDKYFAEWKYFNFTQPGLAGYIVYYILSPEKQTSISGGRLLIRAFKNNAPFGSIKRIPVERIQCDNVSADIVMDGSLSKIASDASHVLREPRFGEWPNNGATIVEKS